MQRAIINNYYKNKLSKEEELEGIKDDLSLNWMSEQYFNQTLLNMKELSLLKT